MFSEHYLLFFYEDKMKRWIFVYDKIYNKKGETEWDRVNSISNIGKMITLRQLRFCIRIVLIFVRMSSKLR